NQPFTMSNLALNAISITVGLFFLFFGMLKLCPLFSDQLYRDMRKIFIQTAGTFPLHSITGWAPNPHSWRRVYGSAESVAGLLLAVCPGPIRDASNLALLGLLLINLHAVWSLGQGLKEASHGMVFGLLLLCRLVIRVQVWQRERELAAETAELEQTYGKKNS
ncbi:hypothetical protein BOX15_Mlig008022g3, partial [Macrostomum lignano]